MMGFFFSPSIFLDTIPFKTTHFNMKASFCFCPFQLLNTSALHNYATLMHVPGGSWGIQVTTQIA